MLSDNGIVINGTQYEVKVECFICDAPARSHLKAIKYHSGKW